MMSFDEGFARYVAEVTAMPELTEEQERDATEEQLILSHLGLSIHIAKRYARSVDELMDRVQDANTGLCQAARAYDPSRGRFSVCASLYMRAAIRNRLTDRFGKPLRERSRCDAQFETWDTAGHEKAHTPFDSLDEAIHVDQVVRKLTPKQREVLQARLEGDTLAEIATRRGTSHQAVRELEKTATREAATYAA